MCINTYTSVGQTFLLHGTLINKGSHSVRNDFLNILSTYSICIIGGITRRVFKVSAVFKLRRHTFEYPADYEVRAVIRFHNSSKQLTFIVKSWNGENIMSDGMVRKRL